MVFNEPCDRWDRSRLARQFEDKRQCPRWSHIQKKLSAIPSHRVTSFSSTSKSIIDHHRLPSSMPTVHHGCRIHSLSLNSSCRLAGKQLSRHRLSSVFYHLRRLRIITASNKYWNDLLPTYTAKSDARIQNWNESSSNFVWVCVSVVCVRACSFSLFFLSFVLSSIGNHWMARNAYGIQVFL